MEGDFRLGPWIVRPSLNSISRNGTNLHLEPKAMEVLVCLAQHGDSVVSKEKLIGEAWGDTFVGDDALTRCISELRRAFEDDAKAPRVVETIPKRGYRLLVEVTPIKPRSSRPRYAEYGIGAAIVVAVFAGLFWFIHRTIQSPPQPLIIVRSVAVLPLVNFSNDPDQDYFADGMTNELITSLAKIQKLRVISRTSVVPFRGSKKSIREIGKDLSVDTVLEGSVQHSGNRVRITAQLIRTADDTNLWADSYDGDLRDVLSLEAEVARAVAKHVRAELTTDEQVRIATVAPVDPEAYQLYLRGLHAWNQGPGEGAANSQKYFQQAIAKDPKFAPAYVGLAFGHNLNDEFQLAKEPARKALELDDTLASAHAALAFALTRGGWDLTTAGHEFKRALELGPNDGMVLHSYVLYLAGALGHYEEALPVMRRALELDPLSPLTNTNLGNLYSVLGQTKEAILQAKTALEIDPNFAPAHDSLGSFYLERGDYESAAAEFRKVGNAFGPHYQTFSTSQVYAYEGRKAEALQLLRRLGSTKDLSSCDVAAVYTKLGEKNLAFAFLEKAFQEHDYDLLDLRFEPRFAGLRSDPRFQDLLRRIDLKVGSVSPD